MIPIDSQVSRSRLKVMLVSYRKRLLLRCIHNFKADFIDYFRDLPTDSQTTDITHFAVVFYYDVTIEALEIL